MKHERINSAEAHLLAYCNGEPDTSFYSRDLWLLAAQYSLDSGDTSDLDFYTEQTDERHAHREWQGDLPWRENVEFEAWPRSSVMVSPR